MKTKSIWVSDLDPSITVETSQQAIDLAAANPTDARYRKWHESILIQD